MCPNETLDYIIVRLADPVCKANEPPTITSSVFLSCHLYVLWSSFAHHNTQRHRHFTASTSSHFHLWGSFHIGIIHYPNANHPHWLPNLKPILTSISKQCRNPQTVLWSCGAEQNGPTLLVACGVWYSVCSKCEYTAPHTGKYTHCVTYAS